MSESEKTTKVVQTYEQPVEVSLIRGAKGQYRWTIGVKADSPLAALRQIQDIDSELRHRFLQPEPNPTQQQQQIPDRPEDPHARMDQALRNIKAAGENPQLLTEVKQP